MTVAGFAPIQVTLEKDFGVAFVEPRSLLVAWLNAPFTEPAQAPGAFWIQFTVVDAFTRQTQYGKQKNFRTNGYLQVNYMNLPGAGTGAALAFLDEVADHYRTTTIGGIEFNTPEINPAGYRAGNWFRTSLRCPFYANRLI